VKKTISKTILSIFVAIILMGLISFIRVGPSISETKAVNSYKIKVRVEDKNGQVAEKEFTINDLR